MKKLFLFSLIFLLLPQTNLLAQNPFELYSEKDASWRSSIYQLYIQQFADVKVGKVMIEGGDLTTIEDELIEKGGEKSQSMDEAISATEQGLKVFFFIENSVWGGIEQGTTRSGSWGIDFPYCSGFYVWRQKSFNNEGLNFHCGKKDKAHEVRYIIMK